MSGISKWIVGCFLLSFTFSCGGDDNGPGGGGNNGNSANLQSVGDSAADLLSGGTYQTLQVEIQYASGFRPPQQSIDFLQSFLNNRLNKTGGINITVNEISTPGKSTYSLAELREIEDSNRTKYNSGNTIATYFFFADGNYDQSANVLGVAHRNTSMVLFQKRIEELSGGIGQASTELVTSSVMAHEFGHILGLVNAGTPMQTEHQDEPNGRHCDVESCLMYFAVETSGGLNDLIGMSQPPSLDSQCIADLQGNGGK